MYGCEYIYFLTGVRDTTLRVRVYARAPVSEMVTPVTVGNQFCMMFVNEITVMCVVIA